MGEDLDHTSESSDVLSALFAWESLNLCFHLSPDTALEVSVTPFAGLSKKPGYWNKALSSWFSQTFVQLLKKKIVIKNTLQLLPAKSI